MAGGISSALTRGGRAVRRGGAWLARATARASRMTALALVYTFALAPYAVWNRLTRKDPMGRRGAPQESYWRTRARTRQQPWQFERPD